MRYGKLRADKVWVQNNLIGFLAVLDYSKAKALKIVHFFWMKIRLTLRECPYFTKTRKILRDPSSMQYLPRCDGAWIQYITHFGGVRKNV